MIIFITTTTTNLRIFVWLTDLILPMSIFVLEFITKQFSLHPQMVCVLKLKVLKKSYNIFVCTVNTRVIFKVRTICQPYLLRSLTGGFWRSRVIVRPSAMSLVFAAPLSELVAVSQLWGAFGDSIFRHKKHLPYQNPLPTVKVYGEGVMN
jgi:hypothetical protein